MWAYPSRWAPPTEPTRPHPYETPHNEEAGDARTASFLRGTWCFSHLQTLALIKVATILVDNHERKQQVRHQMEAAAVSRTRRF